MSAGVFYRVVRDWAGVRNGRSSSPFAIFADANRAAMKACAESNVDTRVYAFAANATGVGDLIAVYTPQNGRAMAVAFATPEGAS